MFPSPPSNVTNALSHSDLKIEEVKESVFRDLIDLISLFSLLTSDSSPETESIIQESL